MKRPGWILPAAIVIALFAARTRMAYPGITPDTRPYDVVRYGLTLSFDPGARSVSGANRITLVAGSRLSAVRLDAGSGTVRVDSVVSSGRRADFTHEGDVLEVMLSPAAGAADTVDMTVHYRAVSAFDGRYDSGGVLFTGGPGGWRVGTISQPCFAREWWPCNDRPSDKALVTLGCTVPAGMTVVSNGRLESVADSGDGRRFEWRTRSPIATYLVFVGAAGYAVSRDTMALPGGGTLDLARYAFPEDSAKAAEDFRNVKEILAYFSRTFAPYPFPEEQFAIAEVDGHLTMENQTVVAIEAGMITGDRRNENTLVHEIAHQWWGNLVTPVDWHNTWLNEGFATYSEALYIESRKGPGTYAEYIGVLMDQPAGFYAGSVIGRDQEAFWDSFGPPVYYKGAIVLHMLRRMMGDSSFFSVLRSYLADPRLAYGNASTGDFRSACELRHGSDLGWFFDQWVYAPRDSASDRPAVAYEWAEAGSPERRELRITVRQLNAGPSPWRLPFRFRAYGGGATREFAVVDSLAEQEFVFTVEAPVDSVIADPDRDLFMTVRRGFTE
jgi:aminopeptidase N